VGGGLVVVKRQSHGHRLERARAPVAHSYATLTFHSGGRSRIEQNGRWTLRSGDVLLVPAGEAHRMLDTEEAECWALAFCVSCVAGDGAVSLLEPFERVRDGASAVVHIPAARHAFLEGLFRELEDISQQSLDRSDALLVVEKSLLTLILAEVARAFRAPAAPGKKGRVVIEALRFIERNCLRPLTVRDVADAVGRRSTYVTAALTRATGRSAGWWIASGRMAEARRLLLHSDQTIDVIAERVGYRDVTHFIRMFRREHGATPAAWRAATVDTKSPR
jgi:AraC-like DNA-binding protein